MFLETALKNYVLENILNETKSNSFNDIYSKLMNDYRFYKVNSSQYKKAITKRMSVRNKIYSVISRDYGRNNIVSHYYDQDRPMPIWAIFELLSLGEFGNFIACLNITTRQKISASVGIKSGVDADGRMLEKIIFTLKDLRNAVAHNNTVFDTRFSTSRISSRISKYIESETGVCNINFNTIVDYIILVAFMMKLLQRNKTEINTFIKQFEDICETLRKSVPMNIYSKIVYTDTKAKLNTFQKFL
jgi:abortive infection bacteriophage resistance protein